MEERDQESLDESADETSVISDGTESAAHAKRPKRIKKRTIVILIIVVIGIFVVTQLIWPAIRPNEARTITSSELTQAVAVDQLNTAVVTYEGIVDHTGGFAGLGDYHVAYKATITAGIDMGDVQFAVDDDKRIVTATLPAVSIYDPVIDTESLDYMPSNPGVDMQEVIASCKEDAAEATLSNTQIQQTAIQNAKTAIMGLTDPLISSAGYQLVWSDEAVSGDSGTDQSSDADGNAGQDDLDATSGEGASYESD